MPTRAEPAPYANTTPDPDTTTVLAVTLARLRDFTATQDKQKVLIAWRTDYESDNLGFNLFRDIGGQKTKINKNLIAGTALQTKHRDDQHGNSSGHTYRFRDTLDSANAFVQYWLEDVDIAGRPTMHGPVSPVAGGSEERRV